MYAQCIKTLKTIKNKKKNITPWTNCERFPRRFSPFFSTMSASLGEMFTNPEDVTKAVEKAYKSLQTATKDVEALKEIMSSSLKKVW